LIKQHISSEFLALLTGLGLFLWIIHPVVHHSEHRADNHPSSQKSGLPEFPGEDCLECVLTTTTLLLSDTSQNTVLTVIEVAISFPDFNPVSPFNSHGFFLRAPPGLYV
jgi:hypothetical protein